MESPLPTPFSCSSLGHMCPFASMQVPTNPAPAARHLGSLLEPGAQCGLQDKRMPRWFCGHLHLRCRHSVQFHA